MPSPPVGLGAGEGRGHGAGAICVWTAVPRTRFEGTCTRNVTPICAVHHQHLQRHSGRVNLSRFNLGTACAVGTGTSGPAADDWICASGSTDQLVQTYTVTALIIWQRHHDRRRVERVLHCIDKK
eukprot:COSAG02_NODE_5_length_66751_cov_63.939148_63_plen_125_part_00